MADTTDRFQLTLLRTGQAQKEIAHNEAIAAIDTLLHLAVENPGQSDPPSDPVVGQTWIVTEPASGAWAGQAGRIAAFGEGGWTFYRVTEGCIAWVKSLAAPIVYRDGEWRVDGWPVTRLKVNGKAVVGEQQAAIQPPSGGTVIDVEAREALSKVLTALRLHGLIAT